MGGGVYKSPAVTWMMDNTCNCPLGKLSEGGWVDVRAPCPTNVFQVTTSQGVFKLECQCEELFSFSIINRISRRHFFQMSASKYFDHALATQCTKDKLREFECT